MGNKIRPMQLAPVSSRAAARIRLAILLTAVVLVVEVVGGLWAHSLALLSDAGHVVTDLVVLALSLFALRQVQRPATARRSWELSSSRSNAMRSTSWASSSFLVCSSAKASSMRS